MKRLSGKMAEWSPRWAAGVLASCVLGGTGGCTWDRLALLNPFAERETTATQTMVLRDGKLVNDPTATGKGAAELQAAQEVYRGNEFARAEKMFRKIADNSSNPPHIAEEARYYEAECLRRQDKLPKACDTYHRLLNDFHFGAHRDQAMERMFAIADFWLEDTRAEVRRNKEARENESWFVMPASFVHLETAKPLLDQEGRALETLENIVINDINGKRADEALYLAGSVKFYRADYREADRLFSQLVDQHPHSKHAPLAMEYAIISKHLSTGGSDYDARKVAEARRYVDTALRNYVLPADKTSFLERQLAGITMQQAEKDFKMAEFYRRTGHPGSAYFYYEIVRRRYPGTSFAEQAAERMNEVRPQIEAGGAAAGQPTAPGDLKPAPVGGR